MFNLFAGLNAAARFTINTALAQGAGNALAEVAKLLGGWVHEAQTKTVTGNTTVDWSGNNSWYQKLTITAVATLTFTAPDKPGVIVLDIVQDATSYAVTLPTIKNTADAAPTTPTEAANKRSIYFLWYNGTSYFLIKELTNMS